MLCNKLHAVLRLHAAVVAIGLFVASATAQDAATKPDYRVANGTSVAQTAETAPAAQPGQPAVAGKCPFDLIQKPGEHPLAPVLRTLKATQDEIDHNVRDYSCTLVKQERVDGELGEKQHIMLKVMHQPFSVYMSFLKPYAGREVVYVAGQNNGKLIVLEAGVKRIFGKMPLDPQGSLAMSGQKHPITDVGFRNLTAKLTKMWEDEMKFAECDVTTNADTHVAGRSTTMIQIKHPVPRQDFRFHIARLFLDNELKVPIHFDAYMWPEKEGADPLLDESYTYMNLKLNNGYTAREFDAANNPEIFKK